MELPSITLDRLTVSQIAGTVSITCWVVVFIPQIYKIFKEKSARGLSLQFIVIWLAGDIFNVVGAIKQHLLCTVILLAIYYTLADIVLFLQWIWYTKYYKRDDADNSSSNSHNHILTGSEALRNKPEELEYGSITNILSEDVSRALSSGGSVLMGGVGVQPLVGSNDDMVSSNNDLVIINGGNKVIEDYTLKNGNGQVQNNVTAKTQHTSTSEFFYNSLCVIIVVLVGVLSWYVSYLSNYYKHNKTIKPTLPESNLHFNFEAQVYGYISAVLYLCSRIPQILLNFKRKSCDGVSFLFFLFACLGNITFIFSIIVVSFDSQYIELNLSWLLGSAGTLLMDLTIFTQFFLYKKDMITS